MNRLKKVLNLMLVFIIAFSGIMVVPEKTSAAALHTWERYEIGVENGYQARGYGTTSTASYYRSFTGYRNYTVDFATGQVTLSNGPVNIYDAGTQTGSSGSQSVYVLSGNSILQQENYFYYCTQNCTPDTNGGQFSRVFEYKIEPATRQAAGKFKDFVTGSTSYQYPQDGVQGGYWYKYVGNNTIPSITVDQGGNRSINLKSNENTFTLSGQVTDTDNETLTVSATIDGVKKEVTVSNTATAKTWTLTWRTSEFSSSGSHTGITISVNDIRGGMATTTYTGTLNVNKNPLLYWDKYSVKNEIKYTEDVWKEDFVYKESTWDFYPGPGFQAYSFNPITGEYYAHTTSDGSLQVGKDYYKASGKTLYRYRIVNAAGQYVWVTQHKKGSISSTEQAKDQLVLSNIMDFDGTYPENGVHSDGFWYIKKGTNNIFPVLTVDNSSLTYNGSEKITLQGNASDADGDTISISATLDGVTQSTSVSGSGAWKLEWSASDVSAGIHSGISIQGSDGKGGTDKISYTGLITVDKTAPTVSVTPDNQPWTDNPFSVIAQWEDDLSGMQPKAYRYKLSTSKELPTEWKASSSDKLSLEISEEGSWYLHLKAADRAGNETTTLAGPFQYQQQAEVPTLRLNAVGTEWNEIGWSLPSTSFVDDYRYVIENATNGQSWSVSYPTDSIKEEGLDAGTSYQYRIKAMNHVGESAWSELFDVITRPAAVENLEVSFIPNKSDTVNVSFDAVESADSYLLSIKDANSTIHEEELSAAGVHQVTDLEPGTQYTVTVTAQNASGYGESNVIGFLSLPGAPGEFQSALIRETEVELSWSSSPTATIYELLRDAKSRYSGSELTYTDTDLESGTEYDYSIAAKNQSGFGDVATLNGLLTLPGKVQLTVVQVEKDAVSLSWPSVRGSESYVVMVNGVKEAELDSEIKTFKVDSLLPGTEYVIEVFTQNRSGAGVADKVTVRTLPDIPEGLQITDIGENQAKLSWDHVEGADKYKVSVTDDVYFETSNNEVLLTNLLPGTSYLPQVIAGNVSGYGEAAAGEFLTLPASPNDLRLVEVKPNQYTLAWDKVTSAKKYTIYNENNEEIGTTEETSFIVKNLKPGETKTVYVSASNETGEGAKSIYTQRTLPAEWGIDKNNPEDKQPITVGDRTEHSVVVIVNPVEGADQYKVVDGDGIVIGVITAPETVTEIGGLESAKEYKDWTIIPINDAGEGQAAPVPPFVTLPSSDFKVSVATSTTSSLTIEVESPLINEIFVYVMNGKEIYRGKDKSFTMSGLTSNQNYTISVWTENSAGDKTEPKIATGKTQPVPESPSGGSGNSSGVLNPDTDTTGPAEEEKPSVPNEGSKSGFTDIDKSFAKSEILALYDKGIVKGTSESVFEPDRQVTRVEFASMLVRALELQESSDVPLTFEDIQQTAWYVPELGAAILNGVAHGFSNKEFRPFDLITREQAAKMISNSFYDGELNDGDILFKDAGTIAVWAKPEVRALTNTGVISGYPDGSFKPKKDLTRAESAVLIYRALLELYDGAK